MLQRLTQLLFLLALSACFCTIVSADQIGVGLLTYDQTSSSVNQFDITNLTGPAGVDIFDPTDFPITTALTFSVTSLVVDFTSGPALVLPGSDFTATTDVFTGDQDLDCTAAACNLFGDSITSATLTGTLSPTTGLSGLPAGDTGITGAITDAAADTFVTVTPGCGGTTLVAGCDGAELFATGTTGSSVPPVPEPGTWMLMGIGVIGLLIGRRRLLGAGSRRVSTAVA